MRCTINFKGFYDTPETLFGRVIAEGLDNVDFNMVSTVVDECINNIKVKLGISLNQRSIEAIQFINVDKYAAALQVIGQDKYILLVNTNKIPNTDALVSSIYHELCHLYQLNKLFTLKLIGYNYFEDKIEVRDDNESSILNKHLTDNAGHTEYWQELADKINTVIKPAIEITAYLTEDIEPLKLEPLEEDYFALDFDGFYDTPETLFGKSIKED